MNTRWVNTLFFIAFMISAVSCSSTKNFTYFNNVTDNMVLDNTSQLPVSVINTSDILSISISSPNPQASSVFNTNAGSSQPGYIVDSTGYIQMAMLGNVKAEGLTLNQLKSRIVRDLIDKELLVEPIVNIHYLNYKITILGEVKNPSVITVPNEKISVLEAIGMAGDLTIYGKVNTVLLIRETARGQKTFKRLDLTSKEIFRSPFYYLKSGDIIYIEPSKARVASVSRTPQLISYVLSGLSLVLVIFQLSRF